MAVGSLHLLTPGEALTGRRWISEARRAMQGVQEKLQHMEKASHAVNELCDFEELERLLERCVVARHQGRADRGLADPGPPA